MTDVSRAELKYLVEHQREEIRTLNEVGKLLSATTEPQEIVELTMTVALANFTNRINDSLRTDLEH